MGGDRKVGKLVEGARSGNVAAYQSIYEQFGARIFNFLFRLLGSREEAEDLMQQTFLIALKQIGTLRDAEQLESWIFRIARNEVYQRFRKKKVESLDDKALETDARQFEEPRLGANPERMLLNIELGEVIQRVLRGLPVKLREVFVLAVIQNMSYQEITKIVGRSLLSVKTDIYRARKHAREELRKYLSRQSDLGSRAEQR